MESRTHLAGSWVFWMDEWHKDTASGQLTQTAKKMGVVATAREFWVHMDQVSTASIPASSSLHIFRDGVSPKWEDPANVNGGHFRIRELSGSEHLTHVWVQMAMAVVGGDFTHKDLITGVTFSKKRNFNMICLWLSSASTEEVYTCRDTIARLAQREMQIVWCTHSTIAKGAPSASRQDIIQSSLHRRTKSAPNPQQQPGGGGGVDSDDEDGGGVDISVTGVEAAKFKKPQQLNPDLIPVGSDAHHHMGGNRQHNRSKSEGMSKEFIPRPLAKSSESQGPTPPISPLKDGHYVTRSSSPPAANRDGGVLNDAHMVRASNESTRSSDSWSKGWPVRPSPMKGLWADASWSPSYLETRQTPVATNTTSTTTTTTTTSAPPQQPNAQQERLGFGFHNRQPHQQQQQQTPPPSFSKPPRPTLLQQHTTQPQTTAASAPSNNNNTLNDSSNKEDDRRVKSTAFVFQGWLYPAKLNRKERRRIMFTAEVIPQHYDGAVYIGTDIPDGNVDDAREVWLRTNSVKPCPAVDTDAIERRREEIERMKQLKKDETTPPTSAAPSTPPPTISVLDSPAPCLPVPSLAGAHPPRRGHQRSVAFSEN
eukprot:PhM_4_TR17238/c0_g1_i1/m.5417